MNKIITQSSFKLCLVTSPQGYSLDNYRTLMTEAIQGGVTCVQLRMKDSNTKLIYTTARYLKSILDSFSIPLLINDYPQIAVDIDCAGVHLGQTDTPPDEARKLLGQHKIIGLSIESLADLERANQLDCLNYISASAVFPTATKSNLKKIWGIDGLKQVAQQSKYPVVAIGGINAHNASQVIQSGAFGIAVVSEIHSAANPRYAAAHLIDAMNNKECSPC